MVVVFGCVYAEVGASAGVVRAAYPRPTTFSCAFADVGASADVAFSFTKHRHDATYRALRIYTYANAHARDGRWSEGLLIELGLEIR
jgi:hypothetical protein